MSQHKWFVFLLNLSRYITSRMEYLFLKIINYIQALSILLELFPSSACRSFSKQSKITLLSQIENKFYNLNDLCVFLVTVFWFRKVVLHQDIESRKIDL